ncbi:MAG: exosortase-associated EpsI family protein [Thermoguttaceae bacterium]|jgi:hypothetical protein
MKNTAMPLGITDARLWGKVLLATGLLTLGVSIVWSAMAPKGVVFTSAQAGLTFAFMQLGLGLLLFCPAATRLGILIILVSVVHGGFIVVRAGTQPAEVILSGRTIHELPLTLGPWQGEDTTLDPRTFAGTEAVEAVGRNYADRADHSTSVFLATYSDPRAGVYHSPMNCYQSSGWTNIDEVRLPLQAVGRPDILVSVSNWQQSKADPIIVLYWYEMGEDTFFGRGDWGLAQLWKLRGRKTWPPMYKVLLQTPASDPLARARLMDLAGSVRAWLGELDTTAAADHRSP